MFLRQTHNFWVDNYLNWRYYTYGCSKNVILNASLSNIGETISKNIVETVAPINTEITLGEITLDPGAWIILLNVWNPPELGMSSVMLGLQESGDSVIVTGHLTQALAFVVPKIRTTYHIIYAQWGKESITVTNGSIKAIRIA